MSEALKYVALAHQGILAGVDLEHHIPTEARMIRERDAAWPTAEPPHLTCPRIECTKTALK